MCNDIFNDNDLQSFIDLTNNIVQLNDKQVYVFGNNDNERSVHCARPSAYTPGVIATL